MKQNLIISGFFLLNVLSCNFFIENHNHIMGFWEYEIEGQKNDGLMFCEVTDSVFGFWAEDVSYLPATVYSISSNDSLLFIGILGQDGQVSPQKEFVGVISIIDSTQFRVTSKKRNILFYKSSKKRFQKVNPHKEKWRDY